MNQLDTSIHDRSNGVISRERVRAGTLMIATLIVLYLCYRLTVPFLPAVAWALALAVIAHPIHGWMQRRISNRSIAAGLSVLIVALLIIAPVIFVTERIVREASKYTQTIQEELTSGQWKDRMERYPRMKPAMQWIETQLGISTTPDKQSSQDEQSSQDKEKKKGQEAKQDKQASQDTKDSESELKSRDTESSESDSSDKQAERVPPAAIAKSAAPVDGAAGMITQSVGTFVSGTVWLLMQLFITLMTLFFFFRDHHHGLRAVRSLMPLSDSETNEVFKRVDDTIHATIYGSVMVGLVQGFMGGLIFWMLGLPSPLIWGAVMGMLAVVPVLGTFVIWAPTALYLALQGDWTKALILVAWGSVAIGLVDNFLNPFLVGKRMRFHTLLVFFAILGGLALFGASGIILGPLILALADALIDVWRRRTAYGGTLEKSVERT